MSSVADVLLVAGDSEGALSLHDVANTNKQIDATPIMYRLMSVMLDQMRPKLAGFEAFFREVLRLFVGLKSAEPTD